VHCRSGNVSGSVLRRMDGSERERMGQIQSLEHLRCMMMVISVGYVDIKQKLCLLQKCRLKKIPVSTKVDPVLKYLLLTVVQYVRGTDFLPVRLMSQSHIESFFQPCLETFIPETRKLT
jgi:hypothetical protein